MDTNVLPSPRYFYGQPKFHGDSAWALLTCKLTGMSTLVENPGIETGSNSIQENSVQLSVKVLSSWDEVELLRTEWNAILERNRKLTIFSSPEWLSAWWGAFGSGKQLYSLAFRDSQDALVGLVPLYFQQIRLGFLPSLWELRLVGDGSKDSDNLDFVVAPGYERSVAHSLVRHLATNRRWNVCQLNCMATDSLATNIFLQEIIAARWKFESSTIPWSAVELPETWEAYLKQLSPKERGKVGNRFRRLQSRFQTKFYKCSTLSELPVCLENLFRLHQKRWESRGEPGSFASPERRRFYADMAQQFLSRGWLELWLLELNGVAVAAQYGFRYGQTVYSLQEGFDPDHASDSVGYVLRSYALREFIESEVRRYEFLAGENESKLRWGGTSGNYLNIHLARPLTRGSLYLSFTQIVKTTKSWLRRVLPPSLVAFLTSVRRKFS
jgi:CelD/BcsL family acetyltransferase involved in cellulose biosynthesis